MVFSLHREILIKVGALKNNCSTFTLRPLLFVVINVLIMTLMNISSIILIMEHIRVDLKSVLFGILQVSATTGAFYSILMFCYHWQRIQKIAERIEQIQSKLSSDTN